MGLSSVIKLSGGWGVFRDSRTELLVVARDPRCKLERVGSCRALFSGLWMQGFLLNWRSSRMAGGSLLPQPVQMCSYRSILYFCGALNYFLASVKLGFVPIAGVSVIVNGFVDAKGSVSTTMSGPPRKSPQAWFLDRAPDEAVATALHVI